MTNHILKCPQCNTYGLTQKCTCGALRLPPKPAKYSPQDRYGSYRRTAKKELETT